MLITDFFAESLHCELRLGSLKDVGPLPGTEHQMNNLLLLHYGRCRILHSLTSHIQMTESDDSSDYVAASARLEQLGAKALLKSSSVVVTGEGQELLFHFPLPLSCQTKHFHLYAGIHLLAYN